MTTKPVIPMELFIIRGLEKRLTDVFGIKRTKFISSSDRMRLANLMTQMVQQAGKVPLEYPFLFIIIQNLATPETGQNYNARSMRRHGAYGSPTSDQKALNKVNLIPVKFDFEIVYLSDSQDKVIKYAKLWLMNAMSNGLNFAFEYDDQPYDVRINMSTSLAIPQSNYSYDQPNMYEFSSTLSADGFMSDEVLVETNIVNQVIFNLDVLGQDGVLANAQFDSSMSSLQYPTTTNNEGSIP